ncbi:MAG: murein biosynthesis integral membrane protein MurJ [Candidatus Paceibacterota bacterium]
MFTVKKLKQFLPKSAIIHITGYLVILTIFSRLLGLFRDRLLTSNFETSILDAYFSAFRIPDFLYNILILGTLSSAFIPLFSKLINRKDKQQEAQSLVDDVLLIVGVVMGVISVIMVVFAPYLVKLVAISYEGQKLSDAVTLTRIMAISPFIFSISSVLSSVLNAYKKFIIVALAPIVYNIGIIIGIIGLYPIWGVPGLGYGVVLGAILHLLIQIPSIYRLNISLKVDTKLYFKNLKRLWQLYWPRLLVIDTAMISLFIGTIIASTRPDAVTYFTLAFNLNALPLGVIAISFATAIFPYLTEAYAKEDEESFRNYVIGGIAKNLLLLIPIMMLMLNFRSQIVRIVYGGGGFTWEATKTTFQTFTILALSIPFQGLIPLFSRTLFARHNTKTPMIVGIISMLINIVLALVLSHYWGVLGVAAAFSITMAIDCIIYGIIIFRTINHGSVIKTIVYSLQISLWSLGMLGIAYIFKQIIGSILGTDTFLDLVIQVLGASIPALAIYIFITWKLGLTQVLSKNTIKS